METFYIYHIIGRKIGVTKKVKRRMREQDALNYEILETHNDIYEVSYREQELQRQYGYPVDQELYYVTVNKLNKRRNVGGSISRPPKHQINKRLLTKDQVLDIRHQYKVLNNSAPIAKQYNLTSGAILKIVRYETYTDIN